MEEPWRSHGGALDRWSDSISVFFGFFCFFFLFFFFVFVFVFVFFCFLGLPPWHMEVPRLEVELEPQLPAYTTATAA